MHGFAAAPEKEKRVRGDDGSQTVLLEFDVQDKALLGDFWLCKHKIFLNERLVAQGYVFAVP